jgi:hypothetical protein
MKTNTRFLTLLAVFALLAFVPLAMAQKGSHGKPGGGDDGGATSNPDTEASVDFDADCSPQEFPGTVPCKLRRSGGGPYVTSGAYVVRFRQSGHLYISWVEPKRSTRRLLIDLSDSFYNGATTCENGTPMPDLPTNEEGTPMLEATAVTFFVMHEYTLEGTDWVRLYDPCPPGVECWLNVRDMKAGTPANAESHPGFTMRGPSSYYELFFFGDDTDEVFKVTAGSANQGVAGDTWLIQPVQENSDLYQINQARLTEVIVNSKNLEVDRCDHGDFYLPFHMKVTRLE